MLAVAVIVAPAARYLSHDIHHFFIANADMVAVPSILESVDRHGLSALQDWYWPPAPYFLIDFVLYLPIWLVLPDPWLAPAVFMIVQLALLLVVVRWFAFGLFPRDANRGPAAWGALASFALIVALAAELVTPARFVLVSYYRAGSFMLAVFVLGLLMRWVQDGAPDGRGQTAVAGFALTLAAVISDPLVVPAIVGPVLVLFLGLALVPDKNGGWLAHRVVVTRLAAALVGGTTLGLVLNGRLATDESTYGPTLTGGELRHQAKLLLELGLATNLVVLSLVVLAMVMVMVMALDKPRWQVRPASILAVFWVLSLGAHALAMLVDASDPAPRYLQVVLLLPLVWLGPAVALLLSKGLFVARELQAEGAPGSSAGGVAARLPGAMLVGLAVIPAAVVVVPALDDFAEIDWSYQVPVAACVDEFLSTADTGVTGYWEARMIQLHSTQERDLAPLSGLGEPLRINASRSWFDVPYDFAILGSNRTGWDPPLDLIQAFAPGAKVTECGEFTIVDAGESGLRLDDLDHVGGQISYDGCALRTMVGTVDDQECSIQVPGTSQPEFGSFGGYTPLTPGSYAVSFTYSSDASADTVVAELEVVRLREANGDLEIVETRQLVGGSDMITVDIEVLVPDDGEPFVIEARTLTTGQVPYSVVSLTIKRI